MNVYNHKKSFFDVFLKGLLYFFSLNRNPIKEYERLRKASSDADRMAGDWVNVGNDIRNAYEGYKATGA